MKRKTHPLWFRVSSLQMAFIFLLQLSDPLSLFAISTGPGQPEVESFQQIGVSDLVDPFTGDMSYNIPLLNVPGPDGGYPINIVYNAGIGMEQEASWVGLGWNINAGSITRDMRGLPDDLKGQKITKSLSRRDNITLSIGATFAGLEVVGKDNALGNSPILPTIGANFSYNTYNGFGSRTGLGVSVVKAKESLPTTDQSPVENANAAEDGTNNKAEQDDSVKPTPLADTKEKRKSAFHESLISAEKIYKHNFYSNIFKVGGGLVRGGTSYSMSSSLHSIGGGNDIGTFTQTIQGSYKTGGVLFGVSGDVKADVYYSRTKFLTDDFKRSGYGYFYNEQSEGKNSFLTDFYRDKDKMVSIDSKILPYPVTTHDLFHVSGHGINGVVRAYSNSLQSVREMRVLNQSSESGLGVEFNSVGAENKGGGNPWMKASTSSSGSWDLSDEWISLLKEGVVFDESKDEKMYFAFSEEMGAEGLSHSYLGKNRDAYRNEIALNWTANTKQTISYTHNKGKKKFKKDELLDFERKARGKLFLPYTFNDLHSMEIERKYYTDEAPLASPDLEDLYDDSPTDYDGLFGRIDVIDDNGKNYIYGLPVLTLEHSDYSYSTNQHNYSSSSANVISSAVGYDGVESTKNNKSGNERFFSKTTLPAYAHSFLLTEILSDDYRDVDETPGPSDGDLGSYVKIDYFRQSSAMGSRNPYSGVSFIPGSFSLKDDDKATFSYFQKEVFYTRTIETKTHIAVFTLNDEQTEPRYDSHGVGRAGNREASQKARYLKRIDLYEKSSYYAALQAQSTPLPIKTVNFTYDYSLCEGVSNNPNTQDDTGKLTLKEIWFSRGDRKTQKSLHPYVFDYEVNEDYNHDYIDRWGGYQPNSSNDFGFNNTAPYLPNAGKLGAVNDQFAATWNLTAINLPSGGKIEVTYEHDDYFYVQNKRAMNMYKVLGFTETTGGGLSTSIEKTRKYVVISLPYDVNVQDVTDYISGIEHMYFKMMVGLRNSSSNKHVDVVKPSSGNTKFDYVEGYVKIKGAGLYLPDTEQVSDKIWIELDYDSQRLNPIRKAALLHLKNYRTDLESNHTVGLDGVSGLKLSIVSDFVNGAKNFFASDGFFMKAVTAGHCSDIASTSFSNSANYPSMVRLNVHRFQEKRKIGGGHRVQKVVITDNWNAMTDDKESAHTYGYEYSYVLPDGRSSGVAQYEPSFGGEENPMRQPVRYGTNRLLIKDNLLFDELPVGEAFMPAPQVGYSRVTVRNTGSSDNGFGELSGGGVTIHEFYTAKDYPVITKMTSVSKRNTKIVSKTLRFLGISHVWHPGYSQGIYVELNDMHGKPKSVSVYPSSYTDVSPVPEVSRITYRYKTVGGYKPGKENQLDNHVALLYGDANTLHTTVGARSDLTIDLQKSESTNMGINLNTNIGGGVAGGFPMIWALLPDFKENYKMSAAMSVMVHAKTYNGILESITETKEGSQTIVENMMFDPYTGGVLLSSITDRFGEKKYTYNMPAYWSYRDMGPAYKTINGLRSAASKGELIPGDVLVSSSGDTFWVDEVVVGSGGAITLSIIDKSGASPSTVPSGARVFRTANQNRLNDMAGQIVSLVNPADEEGRNWNLLNYYNANVRGPMKSTTDVAPQFDFNDCDSPPTNIHVALCNVISKGGANAFNLAYRDFHFPGRPVINLDDYTFIHVEDVSPCTHDNSMVDGGPYCYILFPQHIETRTEALEYNIFYSGSGDYAVARHELTGEDIICEVRNLYINCFDKCMSSVLDITVATFDDALPIVQDAWVEDDLATLQASNKYRYGGAGIWRQKATYVFQEERTQLTGNALSPPSPFTTRIDEDGIYSSFMMYNWYPGVDNDLWTKVSENTKFNPGGQVVEVTDALNVPQSALYGYGGSLVTASARNTWYDELIFDGFEDHGSDYDGTKGRGNIKFATSDVDLDANAHTGVYGLKTQSNDVSVALSNLEANERYIISLWRKTGDNAGTIEIFTGTSAIELRPVTDDIDGWTLYEANFLTGPSSVPDLIITDEGTIIDDLRIHRQAGQMRSFVYEYDTHRLIAIMDEQNFAMHYVYNDAGDLIQVRKETVRGMQTLKGHRKGEASISNL